MPAGSVVVFAGTLWHRGGANRSDRPRLAHHAPVLRTVGPPAGAADPVRRTAGPPQYSERIQSLLGYSIHPPFMGHVDGLHPLRLLDPQYNSAEAGAGKVAADYWIEAEEPGK